jgi:hypothetical protein
MFVLSFKMTKTRLALGIISIVAVTALAFSLFDNSLNAEQTATKVENKAASNEERLLFLSSFGWETDKEPAEVVEVIIPNEFDVVYEKYNAIQKAEGYDLSKYKGKRVKRYTYVIKNYPTKQEATINANLLVYDNKIIGGDVCSVALGGFIHGFKKQ